MMCEFHESTCNVTGFGDIWSTDNPIYFSSIDYIMDIHMLIVMCIPNIVYKYLYVSYTVVILKLQISRGEYVGACCNSVTLRQIVRIFGVTRANCDTKTLEHDISIVIKSILSDLPIENLIWR